MSMRGYEWQWELHAGNFFDATNLTIYILV